MFAELKRKFGQIFTKKMYKLFYIFNKYTAKVGCNIDKSFLMRENFIFIVRRKYC